jgi:two-component system alkaline phosphatase synthesis response regulator PhoP
MAQKMLIADDEKEARLLWTAVAQAEGLEVAEALDGREALDRLKGDDSFDVVVLDVMMPFLDGYEVLKHMREDERLKAVPVIISTANRTTQDLDEMPVDVQLSFVNKAAGVENMRRGISRALGRPAA